MSVSINIDGVIWDVKRIKEAIRSNDRAAIKALLRIYAKQTAEEKQVATARRHNGVGFNKYDAPLMTQMAQQWYRAGWLYPNQMRDVKVTMEKYAAQILDQMIEERRAAAKLAATVQKPTT